MIITTIQPKELGHSLANSNCVYPDDDVILHSNSKNFITAYDWMVRKMDEHSIYGKNSRYPFWGWAKYDWNDTISGENLNELMVPDSCVIKMEIPDENLLLSDFDAWHCVLNASYFNDALRYDEWSLKEDAFDNMSIKKKAYNIKKSWDNIFNISEFENEFCSVGRYVQAVFWCIKPEYVISII